MVKKEETKTVRIDKEAQILMDKAMKKLKEDLGFKIPILSFVSTAVKEKANKILEENIK